MAKTNIAILDVVIDPKDPKPGTLAVLNQVRPEWKDEDIEIKVHVLL